MNIGNFYYKDYFAGLRYKIESQNDDRVLVAEGDITSNNNRIISAKLHKIARNADVNQTIRAEVDYPGLITGIGIEHSAAVEKEFKLGMHFDYTTGMPVVYGSSVKGVLKSYFNDFYEGEIDAEILLDDIFNGIAEDKKAKSIYDRDIFFDAVITGAANVNGASRIIESDCLAPHGDNPLKNPIPIPFIKIASGCLMEFRFKLVDSNVGNQIFTVADKIKLFKEILFTVGIGAKTNVGYGQLSNL